MTKILVNADDFGISKGVNEAVIEMHKEGNLDSASVMVTGKYFGDAIEKAKANKSLKVGLHFNLTTGKSVLHPISLPLLVNENGIFKNGFVKLLILSILHKKQFLSEVEAEMKAQIEFLKAFGVKPKHIDGHRHVHYIFGIFNIAAKLAEENKIERIRVINESLFGSLKLGIPPISGVIKWFVLRMLGLFNGSRKITAPYFFSIIYSCKIKNSLFKKLKIPSKYKEVEVMIHPSILRFEMEEANIEYEKPHLTSDFRAIERNFIKPKI